jgi:hypothetical protein
MRRAQHRLLDRDAGLVGGQQHGAARPRVARRAENALVVPVEPAPGVAREQIRDLVPSRRHERLDRV